MKRKGRLGAALSVALVLAGCGSNGDDPAAAGNGGDCADDLAEGVDYFPDRVSAEYANGWQVRYEDSYKVVTTQVSAAGGHAAAGHRQIEGSYVLVQCGTPVPELTGELAGAAVIEVPVTTLVDGGSVLYAALEQLDVADSLVGVAEPFIGEVEKPYLPAVSERLDTAPPGSDAVAGTAWVAFGDAPGTTHKAGERLARPRAGGRPRSECARTHVQRPARRRPTAGHHHRTG